jgi:hypothetical protein
MTDAAALALGGRPNREFLRIRIQIDAMMTPAMVLLSRRTICVGGRPLELCPAEAFPQLGDHVEVLGADVKDGLLSVDLKREDERLKPRMIQIGGRSPTGSRARRSMHRPRRNRLH